MKIFLWIVIGVLLLIAAFRAWVWYVCRKVARQIVRQNKAIFGKRHDWEIVDDPQKRFGPPFDHQFYDKASEWLEQQGFRALGAIENKTVARELPNADTYLKIFVRDADSTVAACYALANIVAPNQPPMPLTCLEFETCLSDGTFVCTAPKNLAAKLDTVPGIFRRFAAEDASFAAILETHRAHVVEILARHSKLTILPVESIEQTIELQHRQDDKTIAYREEFGWVTRDELRRCAPELPQEMLNEIMRHAERIK